MEEAPEERPEVGQASLPVPLGQTGTPVPPLEASAIPRPSVWGFREALPVILFLLFLAALSLIPGPEPPASPSNVRTVLMMQGFFYLLILAYIHSVVHLKYRRPFWAGLGWQPTNRAFFLTCGMVAAVSLQLLSLPAKKELPIERLFQTRESAFLLAGFGVLVAPMVEEVIFRGFIFAAVQRSWGPTPAIWITAVLFGMVHVPQLRGGVPQIFAVFIVGLLFSWARARTGALSPSYFMHLGYNGTLFLMFYIGTQGFRHMS